MTRPASKSEWLKWAVHGWKIESKDFEKTTKYSQLRLELTNQCHEFKVNQYNIIMDVLGGCLNKVEQNIKAKQLCTKCKRQSSLVHYILLECSNWVVRYQYKFWTPILGPRARCWCTTVTFLGCCTLGDDYCCLRVDIKSNDRKNTSSIYLGFYVPFVSFLLLDWWVRVRTCLLARANLASLHYISFTDGGLSTPFKSFEAFRFCYRSFRFQCFKHFKPNEWKVC